MAHVPVGYCGRNYVRTLAQSHAFVKNKQSTKDVIFTRKRGAENEQSATRVILRAAKVFKHFHYRLSCTHVWVWVYLLNVFVMTLSSFPSNKSSFQGGDIVFQPYLLLPYKWSKKGRKKLCNRTGDGVNVKLRGNTTSSRTINSKWSGKALKNQLEFVRVSVKCGIVGLVGMVSRNRFQET